MRRLLFSILACSLLMNTACATLTPQQTVTSVRTWVQDQASCTIWAAAPARWITAAHCTATGDTGTIDGLPATVLARDIPHDLAWVAGPVGKVLPISLVPPPMGAPITTFGYGMGSEVLLVFPGVVMHNAADFFNQGRYEMLIGIANGMPGMSGGPILWRGHVVSIVTGGGPAGSHAHLVGTGTPWRILRLFIWAHRDR